MHIQDLGNLQGSISAPSAYHAGLALELPPWAHFIVSGSCTGFSGRFVFDFNSSSMHPVHWCPSNLIEICKQFRHCSQPFNFLKFATIDAFARSLTLTSTSTLSSSMNPVLIHSPPASRKANEDVLQSSEPPFQRLCY